MPAQRRTQGHRSRARGFRFGRRFGRLNCRGGELFRGRGGRNGNVRGRFFGWRHGGRGGFHILDDMAGRGFMIPLMIERVRTSAIHPEMFPDELGDIVVQRAGMGFLLGHSQFGEHVENSLRLYLKLPRQLVDAGFSHILSYRTEAHSTRGTSSA